MSIGRIASPPPLALGPAAVSAKSGHGGQPDSQPAFSNGDAGAQINALITSIEDTTEALRPEGAGMASSQLGGQLLAAVRSLSVVLTLHPASDIAQHSERARAAMELVEHQVAAADESAYRMAERIEGSGRARHTWEEYSTSLKEAVQSVKAALSN